MNREPATIKIMGTLIYFIRETFRGFFQAKLMTFVSIITIAVALFFFGCIVVAFLNIRIWLKDVSKQAGIVVYLEDDLYKDSIACDSIVKKINSLPQVESVTLIGKQDAWDKFKKLYGAEMLDAVDENPLPASIDIVLVQKNLYSDEISSLKKELDRIEGIDGIHYSREWLAKLKKFRKFFFWSIVFIVPILIIALHFMIANTIKLTIYARKDLVTNMHFVGATDFYIKIPFILEGMLQGMIGGAIGITGLSFLRLFLSRFSLYWGNWYIFPVIFSVGVIFGWIGSISAVRRFLV